MCILIRGIFRTIEFGSGTGGGGGYLLEREAWCKFSVRSSLSPRCWALTLLLPLSFPTHLTTSLPPDYGLETLPILVCVYLFLGSHPGRYIPSDRTVRLHPEQMVTSSASDLEKEGAGPRGRKWWGGKRA